MYLKKIQILNFRSIKELEIETTGYACHVFVGLNESGKSNILRALSLLSPDNKASTTDIRIERADDAPVKAAHVRFIFDFDAEDTDEIYEDASKKFFSDHLERPILTDGSRTYTLKEFCKARNEGLFVANIKEGTKGANYWGIAHNWSVLPGWHKVPLGQQAAPIAFVDIDGKSQSILGAEFFYGTSVHSEAPIAQPAPNASDILKAVGQVIVEFINDRLPSCIYWQYNEANLLPAQVNIAAFAAEPGTCVPLRSMFELAGYSGKEIGEAITAARSQAPHVYTNLLSRVATAATKHLRQVWSEYSNVTIQLDKNGDIVEPTVKDDQLPIAFSGRSDGFKRFVSFLLLISARVKTEAIQDTLLLVDEPEIALHPSGSKNLRDELIEVGKSNYVFYSTHSIFMIDRNKIDRHLIVQKKHEVTECKRATKSLIQDEEVLFNAIGFSMFEVLQTHNIIFEGWRDKQLFKAALTKRAAANKLMRERIGLTHAEGVKDIKHVSKFLELGARSCLILSDADNVAKQHQKTFCDEHGYGQWTTYHDIQELPRSFITAEDFLTDEYIISTLKKLKVEFGFLAELTTGGLVSPVGKIKALQSWINNTSPEELRQRVLDRAKEHLFGPTLTHQAIVEDYRHVVGFVQNYFKVEAEEKAPT